MARIGWGLATLLVALLGTAQAQAGVDVSAAGVHVQTGPGGKISVEGAESTSRVAPDVEMEGVAVINGDVYVDGTKVPKGRKEYTSPKNGRKYRIHWGSNGNVSVEER